MTFRNKYQEVAILTAACIKIQREHRRRQKRKTGLFHDERVFLLLCKTLAGTCRYVLHDLDAHRAGT